MRRCAVKRLVSVVAVCVAVVSSVVAAQEKPNFSGTWKITGDAADPFTAPQVVVVQDAKTLTLTASSQMGEFKTVFNMDGTPGKSPLEFQGNTIDRTTKLTWDGNKAVLTTTSDFGGQSFETKAVWSLGADGVLQVETTRPDFQGGGPVTTKVTYKKS